MKFTYREQRIEAEREVRMRKQVYPGRVLTLRMRQGEADRHLALMEAIAETLRELEKSEQITLDIPEKP